MKAKNRKGKKLVVVTINDDLAHQIEKYSHILDTSYVGLIRLAVMEYVKILEQKQNIKSVGGNNG